jgi:uncharacterized protein (UPF0332 family)
MSDFRRFVKDRRLVKTEIDRKMILKEVEGAMSDLDEANNSLSRQKLKWATIQGYYSMFHAARALVYSKGFREKSHYALLVGLRELFGGQLETELIQDFEEAMNLRQEADYGLVFSEEGAISVVDDAKKFLNRVKEILRV